jgi:hypothetical protein
VHLLFFFFFLAVLRLELMLARQALCHGWHHLAWLPILDFSGYYSLKR